MLNLFQLEPCYRITVVSLSIMMVCQISACQDPTQKTDALPTSTQPQTDIVVAQTPASIPPASVGLKKVDFPIYLKGIPSLLHPIVPSVPMPADSDSKAEYLNSKIRSDNTLVSYIQEISPLKYQSNIYNLVFEDIKTGTTQRLFPNDNYIIKSIFYPFVELETKNSIANKNAPQEAVTATSDTKLSDPASNKKLLKYFIYEVKEHPSDDDSKTNIDDQLSLYMSDETGHHLVKLHPNNQFVKNTYWLPEVERFYFTTQSDSNGDNRIDANDKYYNYVIDFTHPTVSIDKAKKEIDKKNPTSINPIQPPKVLNYTFVK